MSNFKLGTGSLKKLEGVAPDLVRVVKRAIQITEVDFTVIDGLRTKEQQALYVAQGRSDTTNSRHLTGHAVDVVPWESGGIPWPDPKRCTAEEYKRRIALFWSVADAMFAAADELGVLIQWGNDWDLDGVPVGPDPDESLVDMPHWQLPWPYRAQAAKGAQARRKMLRATSAEVVL